MMKLKSQLSFRKNSLKRYNNTKMYKCISYRIKDANLVTIKDMQDKFNYPVGLSDHTKGTIAAITSVALGAVVIENILN